MHHRVEDFDCNHRYKTVPLPQQISSWMTTNLFSLWSVQSSKTEYLCIGLKYQL